MPIPPEQLSELVDSHWGTLVAWVSVGGGEQRSMAEDIVQEAFIKLTLQDTVPDRPVAWLMTVSRRLAANHRLSASRRTVREQASSELRSRHGGFSGTQSTAIAAAEVQEIRAALKTLRETERRVVIAKLWADLSWDEIAESLDCSRATVWRTYRRAINQLKSIYSES